MKHGRTGGEYTMAHSMQIYEALEVFCSVGEEERDIPRLAGHHPDEESRDLLDLHQEPFHI